MDHILIDSPDWIKHIRAKMNPINKKEDALSTL